MLFKKKRLSKTDLDLIIGLTFDNMNSVSKDFTEIFDFVMGGINYFCYTYLSYKEPADEDYVKYVIAPMCLATYEDMHQDMNGKYGGLITRGMLDYWLIGSEEEDVLSYIERCLIVSGSLKFFCRHTISPEEHGKLADEQEKILKILDSGGEAKEVMRKVFNNMPSAFLLLLTLFSNVCISRYGILLNNEKMKKDFKRFNQRNYKSNKKKE